MAVNPVIKKVFLDILLVFCVFLATALLHGYCKPYRRGYFLEDETIRLPYKPDTMPYWSVVVSSSVFITLTVCFTEMVRQKQSAGKKTYIFRCYVPRWMWESYIVLGTYAFGMACQQLTVEIGKLTVGRLRPHFIAECKPEPDGTPGPYEYITEYNCTSKSRYNLHKSFPSGHSSTAMYAAVYIIIYIQNRIYCNKGSQLLRHILQLMVMSTAWFTCLVRISDHMHHWEDVAFGSVLGIVYAVLTWVYVFKKMKFKPRIFLSAIEESGNQLRPKVSPILQP